MKKQIKLYDKTVNYTLKTSKRAKRIRLALYCDGSLVVTKPRRVRESIVNRFIIQKQDWILSKYRRNTPNNHTHYLKHKKDATLFINKRINHFNKFYNLNFNKISIKNQKTRWGSCSKKRNLNFNYKVMLLPKDTADYIIVHELCHLQEFNHSKRFWDLVSETIPNYSDIRKDLKQKHLHFY